jgi:hypothetical protein
MRKGEERGTIYGDDFNDEMKMIDITVSNHKTGAIVLVLVGPCLKFENQHRFGAGMDKMSIEVDFRLLPKIAQLPER